MAMRRRDEEVVFPHAAGIDVGASSHWVAVPRDATEDPVREFGPMTDDLNAMADWLVASGVDTVALESTGVYWIPVFEVLEQRGLKVWLGKRSAHPPLCAHDHAGFLRGNSSSMRRFGQEGSFSRVSVSQAMGSIPFARAVSSSD
jgi:hypothetical protein